MQPLALNNAKPYRGIAMEGMIATWYARNTARNLPEFSRLANRIALDLPENARVLEIAPGPGELSIELARRGGFRVTAVDISHSFVRIAKENAARAGVKVDFRLGDAADLPLPDAGIDFIVCRAAFKNFSDPVRAMQEMYRVLVPGGTALIIDLRGDASDEAITREVDKMQLGWLNGVLTRRILRSLRKRAYGPADIERMAARTDFGHAEITREPIGLEVALTKLPG
jgi:ubiquinone/menaquinone biosynthesis C-methylase UbiE